MHSRNLKDIGWSCFRLVRPSYQSLRRACSAAFMDRRIGVETSRYVSLSELGQSVKDYGNYEPSSWATLRRILAVDEVGHDDVFVDFGSGKGRVVLQAGMYPMKRVVGVELSEQLTAITRANLEQARSRLRCQDVQLVTADVVHSEVEDGVTIAYFYNPFNGSISPGARQARRLVRPVSAPPEDHLSHA